MIGRITLSWAARVWALLMLVWPPVFAAAQAPAAAQSSASAASTSQPVPVQTGEIDLTFTERSPLSARKEIARRLTLKESAMGADYELAKLPYKAYIPKTYDPAKPAGIFVYLGYKDSVSVATDWEPLLDKTNLIFITPTSHSDNAFPGSIPLWQSMGLALDAVHNLKARFSIDEKRIYLMAMNAGPLQISLASTDLFDGFVVVNPEGFFEPLRAPNGGTWNGRIPAPVTSLLQQARRRAFVIAGTLNPSEGSFPAIVAGLKKHGISRVIPIQVSMMDDVHYPHFKVEWFEQTALPFLDGTSLESAKAAGPSTTGAAASSSAASQPAGAAEVPAKSPASIASNDAQHRLNMAQIDIKNGQNKLARTQLEMIVHYYPKDPAATTAKELLDKLPAP